MKRFTKLLAFPILLFACSIVLVACGGNNNNETDSTYTVTWKNFDGTILKTDTDVANGITPTYDGVTPAKPSDASYDYSFSGWSPAITVMNGANQTYIAQYMSTLKSRDVSGAIELTEGITETGTYSATSTLYKFTLSNSTLIILDTARMDGDANQALGYSVYTEQAYKYSNLESGALISYNVVYSLNSKMPLYLDGGTYYVTVRTVYYGAQSQSGSIKFEFPVTLGLGENSSEKAYNGDTLYQFNIDSETTVAIDLTVTYVAKNRLYAYIFTKDTISTMSTTSSASLITSNAEVYISSQLTDTYSSASITLSAGTYYLLLRCENYDNNPTGYAKISVVE